MVYYSEELDLKDTHIKRDLIFNIVSTILVIVFGIISYVEWWMTIFFLVIYFIYIILVIFNERKAKQQSLSERQESKDFEVNKENTILHED